MNKTALYFEKLPDQAVRCILCPNMCVLQNQQIGICMGRKNDGGELTAVNYAEAVALHLDPVEKKPLYHYYPGSYIVSLAANSCNLQCSFCQNYTISQQRAQTSHLTPENLLEYCLSNSYKLVAFTYTEPFTWYEYIYDCVKLFVGNNIKTVLVTNGYVNPDPLAEIIPYIDAMNVDLKGIRSSFYKKICKGTSEPVLNTIRFAYRKCHLELTNLIIPGLNDGDKELSDLIDFVADVSPSIPVHFSRYFPMWKSNYPVTPEETLEKACNLAEGKLKYVYTGNTNSYKHNSTYCPSCGSTIIVRHIGNLVSNSLKNGCCVKCGERIYGVFNDI